jgi:tetratricopeptide (TPR) repeat protein
MRVTVCLLALAGMASASPEAVNRAQELYQHTQYQNSIKVLTHDPAPDAATYLLTGKNYFMLGEYKKATEFFEKSVALTPTSSMAYLWLGRSWGRRAENSTFMAISYAKKAHQAFEKAVALDPHNGEAKNDLFDYYLNAPGFLGGGIEKAEALSRSIAADRPVEHEFEEAQIAEKRNDLTAAESHFRKAIELAPRDAGRIIDLARFLAKHKRFSESDDLFERARKTQPDKPGVNFAEAKVAIDNHRNLDRARTLLQTYLESQLTPDDPPRHEAEQLLKRAGG